MECGSCCRFDPASLLARLVAARYGVPGTASNLTWGKAVASCRTPERLAHSHAQWSTQGSWNLRSE